MKKLILVAVLLLIIVQTKAQIKFHVGMSTAVNSTFVLDKGLKADPRYLSTATYKWAPVGFTFGVDFGKHVGLSLESIKAAQGQIYEVIDAYEKVQGFRDFDMSYLQFPLLLKFMSGGDGLARLNFQIGPQLSILQGGSTEILKYAQGDYSLADGVPVPEGINPGDIIDNGDGTYTALKDYEEIISSSDDIQNAFGDFQKREIQLAAAVGASFDISRNLYLVTNLKANYSFTDMRGQELLDIVKSGNVSEIFDQRANLAVGLQLELHWMIGGTRFFNAKDKKLRDSMKSEN